MAALAAGCGGDDRRDDVDGFLRSVNDVQQRNAADFDRANRAYLDFSKGELSAASAARAFARGERSMRAARGEIAALAAPSDARRLKTLLIRLFETDSQFAHESTLLARYVPAAAAATRPLEPANRHLRTRLQSPTAERQAGALRGYASAVGQVWRALRRVQAPPVLFDHHRGQLGRLDRVRRLAGRLADAVTRRDSKAVATLLLRFRRLNSASGSGPRALTKDALRAYNVRFRAVRDALQDVQRERARLERRFG